MHVKPLLVEDSHVISSLIFCENVFMNVVCCNPDWCLNPISLRKAKIAYNFGLSECNRVKG